MRKKSQNTVPKIETINGLTEFLDLIAKPDDRILVIEFYASWCKSCHKFGMKFKQLARTHGDLIDENGNIVEEGKVRFAQIEYGANSRLCKTFGIKKLPFVQIYKAPLGKITEFICGPATFDEKVKSRLERYLSMTDEEIKFSRNMEEGQVLGDSLLEEVKGIMKKENATSTE